MKTLGVIFVLKRTDQNIVFLPFLVHPELNCPEQRIVGTSRELAFNKRSLFCYLVLIFQTWNKVLIWHSILGYLKVPGTRTKAVMWNPI